MRYATYTDNEGFVYKVLVREDAVEDQSKPGIIVGPPSLDGLKLTLTKRKELQRALVEHNLITAPDLKGKRLLLIQILKKLDIDPTLVREIIHLYQIAFYGTS